MVLYPKTEKGESVIQHILTDILHDVLRQQKQLPETRHTKADIQKFLKLILFNKSFPTKHLGDNGIIFYFFLSISIIFGRKYSYRKSSLSLSP